MAERYRAPTLNEVVAYIDQRIAAIAKAEGRDTHGSMPRGPYLSAWDDVRAELADGAVSRWVSERRGLTSGAKLGGSDV